MVARIEEIDPDLPLRDRLVVLVSILQQRFRATFELMQKVGMVRPARAPARRRGRVAWRARLAELLAGGGRRRRRPARACPSTQFVHVLRLLTFAGSHEHIADGRLLTPDQIVDTVLHGAPGRKDT